MKLWGLGQERHNLTRNKRSVTTCILLSSLKEAQWMPRKTFQGKEGASKTWKTE